MFGTRSILARHCELGQWQERWSRVGVCVENWHVEQFWNSVEHFGASSRILSLPRIGNSFVDHCTS